MKVYSQYVRGVEEGRYVGYWFVLFETVYDLRSEVVESLSSSGSGSFGEFNHLAIL